MIFFLPEEGAKFAEVNSAPRLVDFNRISRGFIRPRTSTPFVTRIFLVSVPRIDGWFTAVGVRMELSERFVRWPFVFRRKDEREGFVSELAVVWSEGVTPETISVKGL